MNVLCIKGIVLRIQCRSLIRYIVIALIGLFYPILVNAQAIPATIELKNAWQVLSSQSLNEVKPQNISMPGYDASSWYHAKVPSTVLNVLVQNGVYNNILDGLALKDISQEPFDVPWWYRTAFNIKSIPNNAQLDLNGINYSADIWLNGHQIATKDAIYGMYKQYQLNITPYLQKGTNVLAIKVYPPKPEDFRIGFTDWNPNPPDRSMGIYRGVQIRLNNGLEIKNPFVRTELNSPDNDEAKLSLQLTVINHQDQARLTTVAIKIDSVVEFTKEVYLAPHEEKIITLTAKDEKKLKLSHPKLWWPNQMGQAFLYHLTASIMQQNKISDQKSLHFGIRKIETFVAPYQETNTSGQSYYRGFKINGRPFLIRGGAWTDSMLLNDTPQHVKDQLNYVKAMNLNSIRLEGFWGNDKTLYETCDQLGILIMMGWSAQWEWPMRGFRKKEQCDADYGCYTRADDQALIIDSFKDQMTWLRNSPSIFVWMFGSDLKPLPELESNLAALMKTINPDVPYVISAAETNSSLNNQPSGLKMRGPYAYVPPIYWFKNTTGGGAFGFNSETGPGAQVPPLESLQRLLGNPQDYWPNNNPVWIYHLGDHPKFQTLDRYDEAMAARYGTPNNIEEYAQKAQLINYESVRPMFEAFIAYKAGNPYVQDAPATGVYHWMLNAAWPKFFWQLYDYYLVPGSAYFSAKEANKPLHVLYNYANKSIYINNNTLTTKANLEVVARMWDANSNQLAEQHWHTSIAATQAKLLGQVEFPDTIPSSVYFIELILKDENNIRLDRNVYWLSTTPDQIGDDTIILQHANYQELNHLPQAKVSVHYSYINQDTETKLKVILENKTDHMAFFNRLMVKTQQKASIAPIDWSDNFITLFPHQSETITAHFRQELLQGDAPELVIEGMNSPRMKFGSQRKH